MEYGPLGDIVCSAPLQPSGAHGSPTHIPFKFALYASIIFSAARFADDGDRALNRKFKRLWLF